MAQSIHTIIVIDNSLIIGNAKLVDSKIILTEGEREFKFSKLFIGTIKIVNTGLIDYEGFDFGITCPDIVKLIYTKTSADDRFHNIILTDQPTISSQVS